MRRLLMVGVVITLAVSALGAQVPVGGSGPGDDPLWKLVAANNLELKGHSPFYLSMSFQLFDMEGKPTGTGTLEKWWAEPGSSRYAVHMPGLDEKGAVLAGADNPALRRDAYLISALAEAVVRPVMAHNQESGQTLNQETQAFGKTSLRCLTETPKLIPGQQANSSTYCTNLTLDDVRLVIGAQGNMKTLRNSVGKFHDTYVSLAPLISFFGRDAISGKITALHDFDPAKSDVQLSVPIPEVASPAGGLGAVRGGVIAGKRVSFVEPNYPVGAKMMHLSGRVLLHAVIGKDGSIRSLQPIASTNSFFNEAAQTAVQQWTYSPYLLNGAPTEVDTTITVNFQQGRP